MLEGLVVGVITGFIGVGDGFLIISALVLLGGLAMRRAVGTSLFIITLKSSAGCSKYLNVLHDQGLELDWEILGIFSVRGILGRFAGTVISSKLPQDRLNRPLHSSY